MSRVFVRQTHAAFERRAKNDRVVNFITEKFFSNPKLKVGGSLNQEEVVRLKNEEEVAKLEARKHLQKQKEKEVKEVLDQQVVLLKKEKESIKKQHRDIALAVGKDVETFKEEQKRKKVE
jgi:hypothetical protein